MPLLLRRLTSAGMTSGRVVRGRLLRGACLVGSVVALHVLVSGVVAAQSLPSQGTTSLPGGPLGIEGDEGVPRLGVLLGGALHSGFHTGYGEATRDFVFVAVRRSWPLGGTGFLAIDYMADLIPAALSTGVSGSRDVFTPCDPVGPCLAPVKQVPMMRMVYGVGLAPIGFAVRLFRGRAVQVQVEASGGALWFTRPVPDSAGTKFNFTAQVGAGLQFRVVRHAAMVVRYHLHHTSNAGTGTWNPGLNSFVASVGVMRTR
jgi:lipid A 3-O-deacylase PagL